ncbi:MAG: LysR family transcriptional regulator, partial [Clostridia bacterium]|nr:LysR family transcriptional regulator [Clostridia bacterium]
MELLQLKYFCDAAETQNFSKTAKKYLVPTSNISQSIKRLEKE